jgi:preprotein translocase subunit SecG
LLHASHCSLLLINTFVRNFLVIFVVIIHDGGGGDGGGDGDDIDGGDHRT